jgi:hypothetical protein
LLGTTFLKRFLQARQPTQPAINVVAICLKILDTPALHLGTNVGCPRLFVQYAREVITMLYVLQHSFQTLSYLGVRNTDL